MTKKDQKYMTDRFGDKIPTRIVSAYDRKRDQIVRRIARRYIDAQAMLERVKAETIADLDTLEQMALADSGVKDFKAKGGNSTVTSFDGLISVQCKNRTFSAMDERAHIAKPVVSQRFHSNSP